MFNSLFNNRGIGLIEVSISLFLTSIGILGLLSLQPSAWNLSGRSELLGRAGELLHKELEANQMLIMNPSYPNPCSATNPVTIAKNVYISGQSSAQPGDVRMGVETTIQDNLNSTWSIRVKVTWPRNANGISDTRIVTRQEGFRYGGS